MATMMYGRNVPSMLITGLGRTAVQDGRVSVAVVSCMLPRSVEVNAFVCASSSRLVRGHAGAARLLMLSGSDLSLGTRDLVILHSTQL